ncbi:hypothetical protein DFH06DRAFT_1137204 [Mycena polygramma]|nr:hypothetical protein DFH06DRAFT_1137204 [Mycena polygramma]
MTQAWWPGIFSAYWSSFSWRLPLSQEPDEEDADALDESELTDEEKAVKVKVLTDTEAKIKRWFSYRRAPGSGASNPYAKFLRQLQSDDRQPKPAHLVTILQSGLGGPTGPFAKWGAGGL